MAKLVTLQATYRIVTPMFLGGANPTTDPPELRPPSIKGALRFWYRAIDPDYREHEAGIFGGTGKDEGQSQFFVAVSDVLKKIGPRNDDRWNRTQTAYLGYGAIVKSLTTRPYLDVGTSFTLSLQFKPCIETADRVRVAKALWALSMLGGLGARSRRGFGSLAVLSDGSGKNPKDMEDLPSLTPRDEKDLIARLKSFFNGLPRPAGLREHTSWSTDARCVMVCRSADALTTLAWLGREMHDCRSYRGGRAQPWVTADHDLMHDFINKGIPPTVPPLRAAFGLPHNYFFSSLDKKKGGIDFMNGQTPSRRASPLLLRIHEFASVSGAKKSCVVATFLPAKLIPQNSKVRISGDGQLNQFKALPDNFTAVSDLMDRLAKLGTEI